MPKGITPRGDIAEPSPGGTENLKRKKIIPKRLIITILIIIAITTVSIVLILPKYIRTRQLKSAISQGESFLADHQYQLALAEFDKALKVDSASIAALIGAGKAYLGCYNYREAETTAQKLIEIDPTCIEGHELLCQVRIATEDILGAFQCIADAREIIDKKALENLFLELDNNIALSADADKAFENEPITVRLHYSNGTKTIDLTPEWTVAPDQAKYHSYRCSLLVTSAPGDVKVTAVFGPLVREIVLVFTAKEQPPAEEEPPEEQTILIPEYYYSITSTKKAVGFLNDVNRVFLLPLLTDPTSLTDEELLNIAISWLHMRTMGLSAKHQRYSYPAAEVQSVALGLFGLAPRTLKNQDLIYFDWDPDREMYDVVGSEYYSWMTHVFSEDTSDSLYTVVVTHYQVQAFDSPARYLDEDYNLVWESELNEDYFAEPLEERILFQLPRRRYVFKIREDGSCYLTEVSRLGQ